MKILYVGEGTYAATVQRISDSFLSTFPQRRKHIIDGLRELGHEVFVETVHLDDLWDLGEGCIETALMRDKFDIVYTDNPLVGMALDRLDVFDYVDWYSDMYRAEFGEDEKWDKLAKAQIEVLKKAKAVIAQGEGNANHARRFNENVTTISNGVDLRMFHPPTKWIYSKDKYRIVFAGKLTHWYKHILTIVETVGKLGEANIDVEMLVIGDGDLLPEIRKLEKRYKNISAPGAVPYESIPTYLRSSDIAVFPVNDDSPLAIYEYLATGLPIIAVGPQLEWFLDSSKNAYFIQEIDADDEIEWGEAIIQLVNSRKWRKDMSERNMAKAQIYDWRKLVKRYEEVLENVIADSN